MKRQLHWHNLMCTISVDGDAAVSLMSIFFLGLGFCLQGFYNLHTYLHFLVLYRNKANNIADVSVAVFCFS